jgi:undecaprenyl-diphosphatase
MSELLNVIVLAIVQGVAEFLPISSSGHLAVIGRLLDAKDSVELIVALHAGTLLAIVIFYFKSLLWFLTSEGLKFIPKIILATIPVGILGMILQVSYLTESLFSNLVMVGCGFIFTASMLLYSSRKKEQTVELQKISWTKALIVGIAQAIAVFPGVSRSGTTIGAGLALGMKKEDAATFSFLLAIPAIGGATVVEAGSKLLKNEVDFASARYFNLGIGFLISAVVGYLSLALLLKVLKKGKLSFFAYYCFILGLAVIVWGVSAL